MTNSEKRKHCAGCYDNFYNCGGKECWSLDDANLVLKKEVHINDVPPWNNKPKKVLNCYHRPQYFYTDPSRVR